MKYYTIEIVTKDGVTSQAIFERADIDVAKKEFHNTLAYSINLDGVEKVSVAVANEGLTILMKETWEMPVPEPESMPTPEPTEPETLLHRGRRTLPSSEKSTRNDAIRGALHTAGGGSSARQNDRDDAGNDGHQGRTQGAFTVQRKQRT